MRLRSYAAVAAQVPLAVVTVPAAVGLAAARRLRRPARRPAVLFGMTPIINIKYWSRALRRSGYVSESLVYEVYSINEPGDFDYLPARLFPRLAGLPGFGLLARYLCFVWSLRRFDVLVLDFDGGCLRGTILQYAELPLRRLARQRIVSIPYGSDAMDVRRFRNPAARDAVLQDYPALADHADRIARRVRHQSRWSSVIVCGGMMVDFLPRHDVLVTSPLAVDTEEWRPARAARDDGVVRILHAPNHRHVKGTAALEAACEELRGEGLPVELVLRERVPNAEIRKAMADVDIVASAFVLGFYELFAIEGMAMAKPVLNYWRPDLLELYSRESYAAKCPVVDAPPGGIADALRRLAADPELRRRLGEEGRRYVERHHSYEAIGELFEQIVERAWASVVPRSVVREERLA